MREGLLLEVRPRKTRGTYKGQDSSVLQKFLQWDKENMEAELDNVYRINTRYTKTKKYPKRHISYSILLGREHYTSL